MSFDAMMKFGILLCDVRKNAVSAIDVIPGEFATAVKLGAVWSGEAF